MDTTMQDAAAVTALNDRLDNALAAAKRAPVPGPTETKVYSDGSSATGPAPLPNLSPEQQRQLEEQPVPDPVVLIGSSRQPPTFTFENANWVVTYTLGEVVSRACLENGMTALQWNSVEQEAREEMIAKHLAKLKAVIENGAEPRHDGMHNLIRELEVAKALPLAELGEHVSDPVTHEGCVEFFMDDVMGADGNPQRVLAKIVVNSDGKLRKTYVAE